ncbi:hypothetical protein ILYODFUR_001220 [Ilyodon furcidens]|uniref:Uncharacterized protein n=1 Tax=Ilyodon furcidens TaxID=33524 RepID=A0ABV0UDN8_9TELE
MDQPPVEQVSFPSHDAIVTDPDSSHPLHRDTPQHPHVHPSSAPALSEESQKNFIYSDMYWLRDSVHIACRPKCPVLGPTDQNILSHMYCVLCMTRG